MTGITESKIEVRRGASLPQLASAVIATALLTALVAWLFMRPGPTTSEEGDEGHEKLPPGVVELTPEAQENAKLSFGKSELRRLPVTVDTTGTVTAEDARVAHIRPLARGLVERVWVRLGDRVKKGQPLATYDNIQLGELVGEFLGARAVLRQAQAELEMRRRGLDRARELIKVEAIAQQTLDLREAEVKTAEAGVAREESSVARIEEQLHRFGLADDDLAKLSPTEGTSPHREASHATLRAPFDGVITKYDVAQGELVEPERELFTVADLSSVWVLADIFEKDIAKIRTGLGATVRVDAYPDRTFSGSVTHIGDLIDPQTRTAKARVVLANTDSALKLDMFARVSIPTRADDDLVLIPAGAVQTIDNQAAVFVPQENNRFLKRDVELGPASDGWVVIKSGLKAGEAIVTSGSFYLKTALLRERIGDEH